MLWERGCIQEISKMLAYKHTEIIESCRILFLYEDEHIIGRKIFKLALVSLKMSERSKQTQEAPANWIRVIFKKSDGRIN